MTEKHGNLIASAQQGQNRGNITRGAIIRDDSNPRLFKTTASEYNIPQLDFMSKHSILSEVESRLVTPQSVANGTRGFPSANVFPKNTASQENIQKPLINPGLFVSSATRLALGNKREKLSREKDSKSQELILMEGMKSENKKNSRTFGISETSGRLGSRLNVGRNNSYIPSYSIDRLKTQNSTKNSSNMFRPVQKHLSYDSIKKQISGSFESSRQPTLQQRLDNLISKNSNSRSRSPPKPLESLMQSRIKSAATGIENRFPTKTNLLNKPVVKESLASKLSAICSNKNQSGSSALYNKVLSQASERLGAYSTNHLLKQKQRLFEKKKQAFKSGL